MLSFLQPVMTTCPIWPFETRLTQEALKETTVQSPTEHRGDLSPLISMGLMPSIPPCLNTMIKDAMTECWCTGKGRFALSTPRHRMSHHAVLGFNVNLLGCFGLRSCAVLPNNQVASNGGSCEDMLCEENIRSTRLGSQALRDMSLAKLPSFLPGG